MPSNNAKRLPTQFRAPPEKAKKFLNEQKDKYKVPLESSRDQLSNDQQENLNAYEAG